ncbi:protein translocase SEC61 complex subunit gamma [uncultured Methanofollis sp.]|uniref:protein translocase SEC61 complex subunit gamma n=1 Tax=uncultured Methanofollis sp. TaxID=262500 RepID=UPI0026162FD6|nr:protein translocase SEC61 complex subunit gamma [uncultured Methanofollis sp.]
MEINAGTAKLGSLYEEYIQKYLRVLKLARTPSRDEFTKIALVAAVGVFVIGLIGFTIYEVMLLLPQ